MVKRIAMALVTSAIVVGSTVGVIVVDSGHLQWVRPAGAQSSGSVSELQQVVESQFGVLAQRPGLESAIATLSLRDLTTGEQLADVGGHISMVPASTLKILATSFAVSQLTPDHRWQTEVVLPEPVTAGAASTVAIRGSGDPTFGSSQVANGPDAEQILSEIVSALAAAGISSIDNLVVDTHAVSIEPIPRSWTYDDFGNYFGAPVSALNFGDNLYKLTFQPSTVGGSAAIAGIDPNLNWLDFTNLMTTGAVGSGDNGYIFGIPGSDRRVVRGTVPAGGAFPIYGAMPDPADAFVRLLGNRLQAAGISVNRSSVSSTSPMTGVVVWSHQSSPLLEIVRHTNDKSFNLYADVLLVLASQKHAIDRPIATWEDATDSELDWLKQLGVSIQGLRLEDGSGLSRRNLVTARSMTDLLVAIRQQAWGEQYLSTLKVNNGGSRPAGVTKAKSGYIEGVRTLSGTIRCQSGRELGFSIMVNHFFGNTLAPADSLIDETLDLIWHQY